MKRILFLLAVGLSACSSGEKIQSDKRDTPVLYNAFSHNDYTRARPLEDALRLKYNCVEADIHLINDELYVRHDRPADTTGVPTLLDLYIRPLAERISDNWGKVYPDSDSPFFLMIDIKAQGDAAYDLLKTQLAPYRSLFCQIGRASCRERVYVLV